VEAILRTLGVDDIPRVLVLNKCDRLSAHESLVLCERYRAISISALRKESLRPLTAHLEAFLAKRSTGDEQRDLGAQARSPALASGR
jgi:GTP-binding protein HflX